MQHLCVRHRVRLVLGLPGVRRLQLGQSLLPLVQRLDDEHGPLRWVLISTHPKSAWEHGLGACIRCVKAECSERSHRCTRRFACTSCTAWEHGFNYRCMHSMRESRMQWRAERENGADSVTRVDLTHSHKNTRVSPLRQHKVIKWESLGRSIPGPHAHGVV